MVDFWPRWGLCTCTLDAPHVGLRLDIAPYPIFGPFSGLCAHLLYKSPISCLTCILHPFPPYILFLSCNYLCSCLLVTNDQTSPVVPVPVYVGRPEPLWLPTSYDMIIVVDVILVYAVKTPFCVEISIHRSVWWQSGSPNWTLESPEHVALCPHPCKGRE